MAILVDANQIAISHLMVQHKIESGINIDKIRYSIIRVLGRIQRRFSEYGEMILCYDDKKSFLHSLQPETRTDGVVSFYKRIHDTSQESPGTVQPSPHVPAADAQRAPDELSNASSMSTNATTYRSHV